MIDLFVDGSAHATEPKRMELFIPIIISINDSSIWTSVMTLDWTRPVADLIKWTLAQQSNQTYNNN